MQGVVWPWMLIAVYNQIQVRYIQRGSFRTAAPSLLLRVNSEARVGRRVNLNSSNPHSLSTRFELATLASGADSNWPSWPIHSIPAEWFCRKGYYSDNDASASVLESGSCKAPPSRIPVVNRRTDAAERGKRCPLVGYAATNGHSGKPVTDSGADKSVLLAAPGRARQGGPFKGPRKVVETGPQPPPAAVQHPIPSTQHAPAKTHPAASMPGVGGDRARAARSASPRPARFSTAPRHGAPADEPAKMRPRERREAARRLSRPCPARYGAPADEPARTAPGPLRASESVSEARR